MALCHIDSFPYVSKGGRRPLGMSSETFFEYLHKRVPREQFCSNAPLVAHAMDILQRKRTNVQAFVTTSCNPELMERIAHAPEGLIRDIARCMAAQGRNDRAAQGTLDSVQPIARTLQQGIRLSTAAVDLTDAYYHRAFLNVKAMVQCLGPNTFFYNVNPADMYSSVVFIAAGEPVVLGEDGVPQPNPSVQDRWRMVARSFHACKELINVTHRCILRYFFGWDEAAGRQTDPNCLMGVVLSYTRKVEESGRLALHIHGSAQPLIFCVERLEQLFAGPNCAAIALAQSVLAMWLPSPYMSEQLCPTPYGVPADQGQPAPGPYPSGPAAGVDFLTVTRPEAARADTAAQHLTRVRGGLLLSCTLPKFSMAT